jgi:hypothetical protein
MMDLTIREKVVSALMVIAILWLGLFPKPVLDAAKPAILKTLKNQTEITFRAGTPQPPQGGAKALTFKRYRPETDCNILIICEPISGLHSELPQEEKITTPLGGKGGGNSVLMDLSIFNI